MPDMKRRVTATLLAVLAVGAIGTWVWRNVPTLNGLGCTDVPIGVETKPYGGPYGVVSSCHRLKARPDHFGHTDGYVDVLLETTSGPVALRIVYSRLDMARQYVASSTEISPDDAGLGSADAHRLQAAIDARGGLWSGTWTLHYGDG